MIGRDRWLAPDGSVWPSHADIVLAVHDSSGLPSSVGQLTGLIARQATSCGDEHLKSKPMHCTTGRGDVMEQWEALVPKLQAAYGIDYSCLTEV